MQHKIEIEEKVTNSKGTENQLMQLNPTEINVKQQSHLLHCENKVKNSLKFCKHCFS